MTLKGFSLNPHKSCSQLYPSQVRSENVSFSWLAATEQTMCSSREYENIFTICWPFFYIDIYRNLPWKYLYPTTPCPTWILLEKYSFYISQISNLKMAVLLKVRWPCLQSTESSCFVQYGARINTLMERLCDTVHIRSYHVKSHSNVQGRSSIPSWVGIGNFQSKNESPINFSNHKFWTLPIQIRDEPLIIVGGGAGRIEKKKGSRADPSLKSIKWREMRIRK